MKTKHHSYQVGSTTVQFTSETFQAYGQWTAVIYMEVQTTSPKSTTVITLNRCDEFENEQDAKFSIAVVIEEFIDQGFERIG